MLNYTFNRLQTGKPESLCQVRGEVLSIVNTASCCGYTHQYEGLEALPALQVAGVGRGRVLVDRDGNRAESFASKVEPDDRALLSALEQLLNDKSASPAG